jgi:hypothetical protein
MAEEQGFEPWVGYKPTPVFKTGALNHSATPPNETHNIREPWRCKPQFCIFVSIAHLRARRAKNRPEIAENTELRLC